MKRWAGDAVKQARHLARHVVKVQRDASYITLWLATNPNFDPQKLIYPLERGDFGGLPFTEVSEYGAERIQPMDEELEIAELAMAYAAQDAAIPTNLKEWTEQQARARGGNRNLARILVYMEPDTARDKTELRNMIRKLEEWRQGKYKAPSGRNARRVARLNLVEASTVTLGVSGVWVFLDTNGEPDFLDNRRFNTNTGDKDGGAAESYLGATILAGEGVDFISTVEASANSEVQNYGCVLETCCALHVDIELSAGKRTKKRENNQ